MKRVLYFLCISSLFACGGPKQEVSYQADTVSIKPQELKYELIKQDVKDIEAKLSKMPCDFQSLKKEMLAHKVLGIGAIPVAEKIVEHCIGKLKIAEKDSVYNLFCGLVSDVSNELSQNLETKYENILKKIEEKSKDPEATNFSKCLDICGLELLTTEGAYYLDSKYDYIYKLFKGKVSDDLDAFLKLRSVEIKEGYSEDAGLLISFESLFNRVQNWEDFMGKYPKSFVFIEAKSLYTSYLSTFITGMDNSRTFDYESQKLLPEVKALYEKIIAQNGSRKCQKIVSEYYDLLKANDFKELEKVDDFLKSKDLYSMLGVQPETR